jgi:8-oxo-dGTP diphosphatase
MTETETATHETAELAHLAADVVLFSGHGDNMHVLLIERRWNPFQGRWALPGGHLDIGEETGDAAHRELREETGLSAERLTYVNVYAEPGRDPRGRYVTFAWTARLEDRPQPVAADDAARAEWWPVRTVLTPGSTMLAFDHDRIIWDAITIAAWLPTINAA